MAIPANRSFNYPASGEKAYGQTFKNIVKQMTTGLEGALKRHTQDSINPNWQTVSAETIPHSFAFTNVLSTPGGVNYLCPECFNGTSFGVKRIAIATIEIRAEYQALTYDTGTTWTGPRHIINTGGAYAPEVYIDGVLQGSATITDAEKGEINIPGTTGTEENVTWRGWYLDHSVMIDNGTNIITYVQDSLSNISVLPLYNPHFESWSSSTDADHWTESGTVTRESATLEGTYMCRLAASSGNQSYIAQTLSLSSAVTQACFCVMFKTNNTTTIRISMDSGSTWSETSIDPIINQTTANNLWMMMHVNSLVNSTSAPQVEIIADGDNAQSVQCDICYAVLLEGGI